MLLSQFYKFVSREYIHLSFALLRQLFNENGEDEITVLVDFINSR